MIIPFTPCHPNDNNSNAALRYLNNVLNHFYYSSFRPDNSVFNKTVILFNFVLLAVVDYLEKEICLCIITQQACLT